MLARESRPQPGKRRVLEALRTVASEPEGRSYGAVEHADWKASLIRGHRRVRDLYREVLATHEMPQAERASIQDRIARIEAELANLERMDKSDSNHRNAA